MALYSLGSTRDVYGQLTNNTTVSNLDNGMLHVNSYTQQLLSKRAWPFLFREGTAETIANQQYVEIPANIKKVTSVKIDTGTTSWTLTEVPNREFWNRLNYTVATAHTADNPEYYYPFDGRVHIWPTPSTSARLVTIAGRIGFSRLNIADYTTGAITSASRNSTSITGTTSTIWTTPMAGRFLRITASDSPNKGDDEWYEIASVASNTSLTLKKPYRGNDITVGTASYVIGQVSPLPDGYQEAPIYHSAYVYYSAKEIPGGETKAGVFKDMRDELVGQLESDYGSNSDNIVLEDADLDEQINPNLIVRT